METSKIERFTGIEGGNSGAWRVGRSSDAKSLVFLTVVLVALIGSAGALTMLSAGPAPDAVVGADRQSQPASDNSTAVPYFPSQYVNQATRIEEQPATF